MTGGFTGSENTKVTEIFTVEEKAWRTVGDLPRARNGLRATNLDNMIYVLGINILVEFTNTDSFSFHAGGDTEILRFNSSNSVWEVFGRMTEKSGSKLEVSIIDCNLGKLKPNQKYFYTFLLFSAKLQRTTY